MLVAIVVAAAAAVVIVGGVVEGGIEASDGIVVFYLCKGPCHNTHTCPLRSKLSTPKSRRSISKNVGGCVPSPRPFAESRAFYTSFCTTRAQIPALCPTRASARSCYCLKYISTAHRVSFFFFLLFSRLFVFVRYFPQGFARTVSTTWCRRTIFSWARSSSRALRTRRSSTR